MGKKSEGIGVAFKVGDIAPQFWTYTVFQSLSFAFRKKRLDGFLATMTEGRVAHVVR